jgi:Mg-chelatase subunit ChlD
VRSLRIWTLALLLSLSVHVGLTWRIGSDLDAGIEGVQATVAVQVAADAPTEESEQRLQFEPRLDEPTPETLIPNRATVVVPNVPQQAFRAARGGVVVAPGASVGWNLPGKATGQLGTGLGEGAAQFARYVEDLRETGLDVVFVIDATGSMDWVLDEVKLRVRDIISWVRDLVPIARFGLVAFRDVDDPEFVVRAQPLTYSTAKLERFLASIRGAGGGSLGESVLAGVRTGVQEAGWRRAGKRLLILIGDAPPHRDEADQLLRVVAGFHADGGQVTTLDVSDEANPVLLETRLGRAVNRDLYRGAPAYDFLQIAEHGGGDAATLDGELRLTRRLVNLIFGQRYAAELSLALEAIES